MIFQIFITIFSISGIINLLLFKNNNNILTCGIFLYHGGVGMPKWNWSKFDMLGVFNDERGGDACGIYAGNAVYHDNDKEAKYKKYIQKNYPPIIPKNSNTVMGHTRKASYLYKLKEIEYTQPLAFWDNDFNKIKDVVIHNGTLHNTDELVAKYEVPKNFLYQSNVNDGVETVRMNDSQVLAYILTQQKKYDVLKDYQGSATVIFYNVEEDKLYAYSGKSKNHEYGQPVEERPLYFLQGDNHIWMSSMEEPLNIIRHEKESGVEEADKNTLYIFQHGKLIEKQAFDRSNASQSFSYNPLEIKKPLRSNNDCMNDWGQMECTACDGRGYHHTSYNVCKVCSGFGVTWEELPNKEEKKIIALPAPKVDFDLLKTQRRLTHDDLIPEKGTGLVKYARGRYWLDGKLAHGVYHMTKYGYPKAQPNVYGEEFDVTMPNYFINGIMLIGHEEYQKWSRKIKADTPMSTKILIAIAEDSLYPVCKSIDGIMFNACDGVRELFNGKISPFYAYYGYEFKDGVFYSKDNNNKCSMPEINLYVKSKRKELDDSHLENNTDFDNDKDEITPEEQIAHREISNEIANLALTIADLGNTISGVYSDSNIAENAMSLLEEIKSKISNYDLETGLPF